MFPNLFKSHGDDADKFEFDSEIAASFIHNLSEDIENAPEDVTSWVEDLSIKSISLRRFLQWYWPQSSWSLGSIDMFSSRDIYDYDERDMFIDKGLMCIGRACNGDSVWLDLNCEQGAVLFIPIAVVYGFEDTDEDPRSAAVTLAPSLDLLLYRASENMYIPHDSYDCDSFNLLIKKHKHYYG